MIEQEKMIVEALPSLYPLQKFEEDAVHAVIDALPHWIPVTERLPETDDEVLTTYIVNGNKKKRYVETSRYYYDGFSGYSTYRYIHRHQFRFPGRRINVGDRQ